MELLLSLTYITLFIFLINKIKFFSIEGVSRKALIGVFLLKVLAGYFMFLLYTYYYTVRKDADIFKYFDDSAILFSSIYQNPKHFFQMLFGINSTAEYLNTYYDQMSFWFNKYSLNHDNRTLIRLNTILRFFSFGYYQVHNIFVCFLSFIGLTGILKILSEKIKGKNIELFVAVYLLPSVIFWGSGVLKDGFLLFAFGIFLYQFYKISEKKSDLYTVPLFVITAFFLAFTKVYVLLSVIPGLISYYWSRASDKKVGLKFALTHIVYFSILFNLYRIFPEYDLTKILYAKQKNFYSLAEAVNAGSRIQIGYLEPNFNSIFFNLPQAFANVFFRPYISDIKSVFISMTFIENIFIILIILLCLLSRPRLEQKDKSLFYLFLYYVLIVFALIGLVTPVIGAMVRYKVPALPFLVCIFIMLYNKENILKKFPYLSFLKKT